MGIGYSGKVKLGGSVVYATSANVTVLHDIVESGGTYGGTATGSHMATGAPHFYEPWKTQTSVSFDMSEGAAVTFKDLLNSRDTTYDVEVDLGAGSGGVKVRQYWTSMGASASVGSIVSGSVEGVFFKEETLPSLKTKMPDKMNSGMDCDPPLAYWQSGLNGSGCWDSWNFSATQPVSPIYCCIGQKGDGQDREPDYILLGQVNITITASAIEGGDDQDSITVTLGNASISFSMAEVQDRSIRIVTGTGFNTRDVTYRIYRV